MEYAAGRARGPELTQDGPPTGDVVGQGLILGRVAARDPGFDHGDCAAASLERGAVCGSCCDAALDAVGATGGMA